MAIHYINYNGTIVPENETIFDVDNRAFRYGDGLFETMLWQNGDIRFLPYHIERLQKGLQLLQMEDWELYDAFFVRSKVEELMRKNNMVGRQARVRLIVYRSGGGLYSPESNKSAFTLQVSPLAPLHSDNKKVGLIIGLYEDFKKSYSDLSHLKSLNAQIYVLAGIYNKRHRFDEVFLLNQEGNLCESLVSNIFIYYQKTLYTPALSEGCVAGVMRRVVMELAAQEGIPVVEAQINPGILKEADEIFCTNAVKGIQWVMGYKQKRYFNMVSRQLQEKLVSFSLENQ